VLCDGEFNITLDRRWYSVEVPKYRGEMIRKIFAVPVLRGVLSRINTVNIRIDQDNYVEDYTQ
jgi:hypothetical protein